jgi:hypothetical protein
MSNSADTSGDLSGGPESMSLEEFAQLARLLIPPPQGLKKPLPLDLGLLRDLYGDASRFVEYGEEFLKSSWVLKCERQAGDRGGLPEASPDKVAESIGLQVRGF